MQNPNTSCRYMPCTAESLPQRQYALMKPKPYDAKVPWDLFFFFPDFLFFSPQSRRKKHVVIICRFQYPIFWDVFCTYFVRLSVFSQHIATYGSLFDATFSAENLPSRNWTQRWTWALRKNESSFLNRWDNQSKRCICFCRAHITSLEFRK